MATRNELFGAAKRLHAYLLAHHLSEGLLSGPDPGVRVNLRVWRFVKSALPFLPWRDSCAFMQTQGYWILVNWMLCEATADQRFRKLALDTTDAVLRLQTAEGFWRYPLPERRHLVATVEGNWAAAGLLASFAREPRQEWLAGARRWYEYLVRSIGFQAHPPGEAVNYFDRPRGKIPNNSVEAVWLFLRLWKAAGDPRYLEHVEPLLEFVAAVQRPNGELPYIVEGPFEKGREHYLCFQYNAFQFLKLAWADRLLRGTAAVRILPRLAQYLEGGVVPSGASASDCSTAEGGGPELDYYTAVLAAALHEASRLSCAEAGRLSDRCFARLLERQKPDGGFAFSTGDYGFLIDQRSYPRQLAMTLFHLLYGCDLGDGFPQAGASA